MFVFILFKTKALKIKLSNFVIIVLKFMIFETIKEFEDYLFSIKTDTQLKKAKYKEADCLAFYESLGDLARVQVYKDITERIGQLRAKDFQQYQYC